MTRGFAPSPDPAAEPLVRFENVSKRFGDVAAVDRLSLDIYSNEFFALLGPSGCGKTTLLRLLAGFERPDEGGIMLGGRDIVATPPHRRPVNMMFQNYALFPHLTVFENVAFGLRLRRVPAAELRRRVGLALDLVGLPALAEHYPRQLSGGQQQRIAIARSVVLEPRILLFDEPLSNLDLKLRLAMRKELRELQRRLGKTAVYVTHDQSEALALSDRIVVMSKGRIEQIGAPREIYERPANAFVADFVGSSNLLAAAVIATEPGATVVRTDRGLRLRAERCSAAAGDRVIAMVRPEHIRLLAAPQTAGDNRFAARIRQATYLGQDLHVSLDVDGKHELTAVTQAGAARRLAAGDEVAVAVDAADIFLLPR